MGLWVAMTGGFMGSGSVTLTIVPLLILTVLFDMSDRRKTVLKTGKYTSLVLGLPIITVVFLAVTRTFIAFRLLVLVLITAKISNGVLIL